MSYVVEAAYGIPFAAEQIDNRSFAVWPKTYVLEWQLLVYRNEESTGDGNDNGVTGSKNDQYSICCIVYQQK